MYAIIFDRMKEVACHADFSLFQYQAVRSTQRKQSDRRFMLHDLPGAILYILCVSLMKSSAGGYHAASRVKCSVLSYSLFLTAILTYRNPAICAFIDRTGTFSLRDLIYAAEVFIIVLLSPVENPNKRLSPRERVKLKSCSIILVSIVSVIYIFFRLTSYKVYCNMIIVCFCINAFSQIVGSIKYKRQSV